MASHGRSARAAAVLGSVAAQVLAQGSAPVLVVGPGVGWPAGTQCDSILVCVNDSPESLSGVDAARDLSTFLGLPLRVLTVVHDSVKVQSGETDQPSPTSRGHPMTTSRYESRTGTIVTGTSELRASFSATLPNIHRLIPERP